MADCIPGFVQVQTLWDGNKRVRGRQTGNLYERSGNGKIICIDPKDAAQSPELFRVLGPAANVVADAYMVRPLSLPAAPPVEMSAAEQIGRFLYPDLRAEPNEPAPAAAPPAPAKPDVQKLRSLRRTG